MERARLVAGWLISALLGALLLMSATMKLVQPQMVVETMGKWGLGSWILVIGAGELTSTLLFLVPRTFVLGLLLLSAYLGGAIVTHMQHDESFAGPAVFLVLLWVAAGLRWPELFRGLLTGQS